VRSRRIEGLAFAALLCWTLATSGRGEDLQIESGHGYDPVDDDGWINCDGFVVEGGYQRFPDGVSAYSSQMDASYPFESSVADDFFGTGDTLSGLSWFGVYWNGMPALPEGFYLYIYANDVGDRPGALLYSEFRPDCNEMYKTYATAWYCVDLIEPFLTVAGARYWLSIECVREYPPQWGWATGRTNGTDIWLAFPLLGVDRWTPGEEVLGRVSGTAFFALHRRPWTPAHERSWTAVKAMYR
jgi:hypothetical protein